MTLKMGSSNFFPKSNTHVNDLILILIFLTPLYFIGRVYFYTSPDEYYYIYTAIQLAEGKPLTIYLESPLLCGGFVPTTQPHLFVSKYPIGQSVLIAIFYFIGGYPFMFFMNGFFGIFNVIISYFFALELTKERSYAILSAMLVGICPPMIFYSRTLLSGIPSTTFLLLSFLFYLKASKRSDTVLSLISSLSLGFATLLRYPNILFMLPILLNHIRTKQLGKLTAYLYYIPLIPFLCTIILYNIHFFGNPFVTGYHFTGEVVYFGVDNFINHVPRYLLVLNLYPPLGLVITILFMWRYNKLKDDISFISFFTILVFLLFFSGYYYLSFHPEHLFIESTRFMLVVLPYICFYTIAWIQKHMPSKKQLYVIVSIFVIMGIINTGLIIQLHSFKTRQVLYRDLFYSNTQPDSLIIGDDVWDKLFHPYFARTYGERHYLRYDVLSIKEMNETLLPFVEAWLQNHNVYFIDDSYVANETHAAIQQLLTENYHLQPVVSTEQPYEVELLHIQTK